MKYIIIALLCSSCLATSSDLVGIADKIDDGATTSDALRAQAAGMEASGGGLLAALDMGMGGAGGPISALVASVIAIYANDRKRNRNRVKRGERTDVPKPTVVYEAKEPTA